MADRTVMTPSYEYDTERPYYDPTAYEEAGTRKDAIRSWDAPYYALASALVPWERIARFSMGGLGGALSNSAMTSAPAPGAIGAANVLSPEFMKKLSQLPKDRLTPTFGELLSLPSKAATAISQSPWTSYAAAPFTMITAQQGFSPFNRPQSDILQEEVRFRNPIRKQPPMNEELIKALMK